MNIEKITIPKIEDFTGNVGVIEGDCLPFNIKRIFYLYDIQGNSTRGRHAHKELKQFLIAISGSFEVEINDGVNVQTVKLSKPDEGVLIHEGLWSELSNFSEGAVCMVVASEIYSEDDYIRNYDDYLKYVKANKN
ncbi:hypothetical protein AMR72_04790 [Flavobacterium psychrophilum]|nr:hypothetical protein AMR72_04790 [Flavobacterium psychrophilum]AOE51894.1 hypothetical protein ALW18_04785 [Flavobacterium psychrophilum]